MTYIIKKIYLKTKNNIGGKKMRDEYIRKFYNEVKETLDGTIK